MIDPIDLIDLPSPGLCNLYKLQVIDFSFNPLGDHVKYITQAINSWQPEPQLRELDLANCKLPSTVTGGLLQALATRCHQLEILKLSSNDLGDQMAALTSQTHPLMKQLNLVECNLQPVDGHALAAAIQQHRLPQLERLYLRDNPSLGEDAAAAILTAALTHHQRKLTILLWDCNMSEQFVEEWELKCRDKHVRFCGKLPF